MAKALKQTLLKMKEGYFKFRFLAIFLEFDKDIERTQAVQIAHNCIYVIINII